MVSYEQIENGLMAWLDAELLPGLPVNRKNDAFKKVAVTTAALYCVKNGRRLIDKYASMLLAIGLIDEQGGIDVDGVKGVLVGQVPDAGMSITIPMISDVTFYKSDIETIFNYIKKGARI